MKILLFLISFLTFNYARPTNNMKPDGTGVLEKVMNKLNHLTTISYTYKRILDYPGEGYHHEATADTYIEFDPAAQFIGLKYQFSNDNVLVVYNGSESFYCDKKEKTIEVNNTPEINQFKSSSFLFNSPVTLKFILPRIIADQSVPKILSDTLIRNKSFYVVDIMLQDKTLNSLGDYVATTRKLTFDYKVIVDKETFMPVEVLEHTIGTKDTSTTFFTNINIKPESKADNSWYSSSYADYAVKKPKGKTDIIKPGAQVPDSHLTFFASQKTMSISDFKGKIVLLEFWIKDCGYCIEAIPKLNALYDKYKNRDFKILAVNTHDTKSMIDVFISKHAIKYDLLTGGKEIDQDYGVSGFPTAILINKNGRVVFADITDEKKLEILIEQNI
ncbi:MAG: Peroxiredoxin [Mucilaginibacter sp.]|nr:Peroxiredoxin [Mucilaginibacter sp.]